MSRIRVPLVPASVRWLGVLAVALVILYSSLTRPTAIRRMTGPLGLLGIDKYLHFLAYAGLSVTLVYALADSPIDRVAVVVFVAAVAFGLLVELLQLPIPYRTFSLVDALANATGATVVAVSWSLLSHRIRFHPRPDPSR